MPSVYSHVFSGVRSSDDDLDGSGGGVGATMGTGMGPLADSHPAAGVASSSSSASAAAAAAHAPPHAHLLSGLVSQAERAVTVTQRLRNTGTCIVLYVVLMALNFFLLCWEVGGGGYHPLILLFEFLVNVFVVAEVGVGVWGLGPRVYFHSWMNCVDGFLAVMCVGFFIELTLVSRKSEEEVGFISEVDAVLLAARFLFQILRLAVLAYRSRQAAIMQTQEDVDFNAISLEACVNDDDDHHHHALATSSSSSKLNGSNGKGANGNSRTKRHSFSLEDGGGDDYHSDSGAHTGDEDDDGEHSARRMGAALGLGLDTPNSDAGGGGDGNAGHVVAVTPTSYIHLKPSVFLELQNARAFAQPPPPPLLPSVPVAATTLVGTSSKRSPPLRGLGIDSNETALRSTTSPPVIVPLLTPPLEESAPAFSSSFSSSSAASHSAPPSARSSDFSSAASSTTHSSRHSSQGSGGSSSSSQTRTLHPLLANDSELELDLQYDEER